MIYYTDVKRLCGALREELGQDVTIDLGDYEVMPNDTVRTKSGASHKELKGSISRVHTTTEVAKILLLEDRIDDTKARVLLGAAMELGRYMLEQGLLEFGELKPIKDEVNSIFPGDTTTFEVSAWIVRPKAMEAHKRDLEAAQAKGREEAIEEIRAEGAKLLKLGDYGPMLGRSLISQAAKMRMK